MEIVSENNPKIKYLMKLNTSKYRKEYKEFIVEGKHLVDEAKKANVLVEAFSINDIEGYTKITTSIMNKICNTSTTVSEIGLCKMVESTTLSNKVLILDAVQDPGNMGALLRSAKAFGFNTIILGNGCVDIYNDKVIRASQGAIFKLAFLHKNLVEFIPTLKNYAVYGTNVVNGISIEEVNKVDNIAFILGNEGNGISAEVFNIVEKNIYIPMDNMESLNVSVAGSIIMYELNK